MVVGVYRNGGFVGYIDSVSYTRGKFKTTKNRARAKKYGRVDVVHAEIDKLVSMSYGEGYSFFYD